jgi:myosin protein heavy chain
MQLETQLDAQEKERNKSQKSVRDIDRTVKDLQLQIDRRDKTNAQLTDDVSKFRDKVERLLHTIDELQSSDSSNQLQAKRAERELREERERALRLERELEGWKALRMERGSVNGSVMRRESSRYRVGSSGSWVADDALQRKNSNTKGFL